MEKGLPFAGEVSIAARAGAVGAVYELSRGGETAFRQEGDKVVVPLEYATNDGRLLVFLPKKIGKVSLEVPDKVARGGVLPIRVNVADAEGASVPGLLPVEVRVFDAQGRELDGAGWTCAADGVATLEVPLNLDDPETGYSVWCRDRASGLTAVRPVGSVDQSH